MTSILQKLRSEYLPKLPNSLKDFQQLEIIYGDLYENHNLKEVFPNTHRKGFIDFKLNEDGLSHSPLRVGVVLSGGQAAGGHNVIAGLFDALKKLNSQSELFGFLDGPIGIIKNNYKNMDATTILSYRNQGGFDLIGSGRDKIETPQHFNAAADTVNKLNLDGLVIIGGDDSNTNAAFLAEFFLNHQIKTRVVGVPKTIDGDLKNEHIEVSFGFDTATKTFSEIIGNILRDSLSAKKYYFFIKLMGRSASHIALECALQTHPNMTLIGEEIAAKKLTFTQIRNQICDMVEARSKAGKNYGVVLIPEGVIEFIPEFKSLIKELNKKSELSPESKICFDALPQEIQSQLTMDLDPHGNVQVSKIETERLFVDAVKSELKKRKVDSFNAQPLFCGYEGRSCLPSNFDSQYCYALGHVAALLIDQDATGYMACVKNLTQPVENWTIAGIPLTSMIHLEERKGKLLPVIKKALVELDSKAFLDFQAAREGWKLSDDYLYPGPIQFFGPPELTETVPLSI
jgi:pyrophosphate--fructose-6-phosphate 1-phosphotransferase